MFYSANSNKILILAGLLFVALAITFHVRSPKPQLIIPKQQSAMSLNKEFIRFFAMGNKRLVADLIWIQTLLEADEDHYKGKDLDSWMFHRFNTIADLDPRFYENYLYGGMYLSVIKDDLEGAAYIFERGLKEYPEDYRLNYHAGFNYYFEMGDLPKGLELLSKIEKHPESPQILPLIINKLRFETTRDPKSAIMFLQLQLETTKDPVVSKKLKSDIYALKAEHDLKCLNEKQDACERSDAYGQPYIYQDGVWKAAQDFKPYRIHRRN